MVVNKARLTAAPTWMDDRRYEAIFHEYYPFLHGVLHRLTGDVLEADDLTAETFWRLWQQPPPQDDNLAGWLYRVGTRLGYNALRSSRRRQQHELRDPDLHMQPDEPSQTVERRQERAAVRETLRQMPLRDVQVLVLRHSGLRYKEIAEIIDVQPSAVGMVLARAEQRFEKLYRKGEADASR